MNRIQRVRSVCAALLVVLSPILFSNFAHAGDVIKSQNTDRLTVVEDSLVSIFENSTLEIQYGFLKDIGDGNGFTAAALSLMVVSFFIRLCLSFGLAPVVVGFIPAR